MSVPERFVDVAAAPLGGRVAHGIGFAMGGVRMTLARSELRWVALACVLINFVVYGALVWLGWWLASDVAPDPSQQEGWARTAVEWLGAVLVVVLFLAWLLVAIWLAIFITGMLSGPLFDLLSERTEELLLGRHHGPPFSLAGSAKGALVEVSVQLKLLFVYLPVTLVILLVNLFPVVGQLVSSALAWLWTALWVAMTFSGPSFARHGLRATHRVSMLFGHKALGAGFGAVGGVPFLSFVLLPLLSPALVVGMTRMYLALAAHDRVPSKLSDADKAMLRREPAQLAR